MLEDIHLPHSVEAEQAIINALLSDNKNLHIIEKIDKSDFYMLFNTVIFEAIKILYKENEPIDIITVNNKVKELNDNKTVKEMLLKYINDILLNLYPTQNIDYYVKIIKDKKLKRQIIDECKKAIAITTEETEDPINIKTSLAQTLDNIGLEVAEESDKLSDIYSNVFDELENFDEEELKKYYTGIPDLDTLTHGLHKEEVMVLAGRPGTGKTALAIQMTIKLASRGLRVLFISREMSKAQVAKRILATHKGIDGKRLRGFKPGPEEWDHIVRVMGQTSNLPIFINTRARTVSDIKSKIRETKADVLIIDYLQLLQPTTKSSNREREVAELSREIKNISLDFKMPVLLLSQLNRLANTRKPSMADLRESGSIEQDANAVVLLHLPSPEELYKIVEVGHDFITRDLLKAIKERGNRLVQAIVAKQRDGETGEFYLEYYAKKLTFLSYSKREG